MCVQVCVRRECVDAVLAESLDRFKQNLAHRLFDAKTQSSSLKWGKSLQQFQNGGDLKYLKNNNMSWLKRLTYYFWNQITLDVHHLLHPRPPTSKSCGCPCFESLKFEYWGYVRTCRIRIRFVSLITTTLPTGYTQFLVTEWRSLYLFPVCLIV